MTGLERELKGTCYACKKLGFNTKSHIWSVTSTTPRDPKQQEEGSSP